MAKRPRQDEPDAWHHVANRGARRQQTFHNAADCRLFLYLLAEARNRFNIETHAFCLMGNHYHLLLHSPGGNLAAAMQMIGTNYTRRFNRRHGFDGPLFKAAYWSKRITTDAYLLQASRYIHHNPRDLGPTVDPRAYNWSSLRYYARPEHRPKLLTTDFVARLAGGTDRYLKFTSFERLRPHSDYETEVAKNPGPTNWLPGHLIPPAAGPVEIRLVNVDEQVARAVGISVGLVREGARGQENLGRLLAIHTATDLTGAPAQAISEHYNYSSVNSMRSMLRRNAGVSSTESFVALYDQVVRSLS